MSRLYCVAVPLSGNQIKDMTAFTVTPHCSLGSWLSFLGLSFAVNFPRNGRYLVASIRTKLLTSVERGAVLRDAFENLPMDFPMTSENHRASLRGNAVHPTASVMDCPWARQRPTIVFVDQANIWGQFPSVTASGACGRNRNTPHALHFQPPLPPLLSTAGSVCRCGVSSTCFSRPSQCYSSTIHLPGGSTCGIFPHGESSQAFRLIIFSKLLMCKPSHSAGQLLGWGNFSRYELEFRLPIFESEILITFESAGAPISESMY